jgi:hypothetical protein
MGMEKNAEKWIFAVAIIACLSACQNIIVNNPGSTTTSTISTSTTSSTTTTTTLQGVAADLELSALKYSRPADPLARTITSCSLSIKNKGSEAISAKSIHFDFYLSSNATLDKSTDICIGSVQKTLSLANGSLLAITFSAEELAHIYESWGLGSAAYDGYYLIALLNLDGASINDTNTANNSVVSEIPLVYGSDLVEPKGTISVQNTGSYLGVTHYASNVKDKNLTTDWAGTTIPTWLKVSFDKTYSISTIRCINVYHTTTYNIDVSTDGTSWTTIHTRTTPDEEESGVAEEPDDFVYHFTQRSIRYVRIYFTASDAPGAHIFQAMVSELQVFE